MFKQSTAYKLQHTFISLKGHTLPLRLLRLSYTEKITSNKFKNKLINDLIKIGDY